MVLTILEWGRWSLILQYKSLCYRYRLRHLHVLTLNLQLGVTRQNTQGIQLIGSAHDQRLNSQMEHKSFV